MTQGTQPVFTNVIQIGIVVKNAESVVMRYKELLGMNGWQFNQVDTAKGIGNGFKHLTKSIQAKALIAWIQLGNVELELIEPQEENSVYAQFLREKGPGIHHVMFTPSNYQGCIERMKSCGIATLAEGKLQKTRFQLFDTH